MNARRKPETAVLPSPEIPEDQPQHVAPKHLRDETRAWWRSVVETYDLEAHHLCLLLLCCEAWDRGQEAREQLKRDGTYYSDRFGQPRAHPAVNVERDARISFARLLRELDLDVEPPREAKHPPELGRA